MPTWPDPMSSWRILMVGSLCETLSVITRQMFADSFLLIRRKRVSFSGLTSLKLSRRLWPFGGEKADKSVLHL